MSLILLVFGILIAGSGVVAIAFGLSVSDSALGQSLIITGAITVVGGPMLMGVAALISRLSAIAESLRLRPTAQIPRLADARQPSDSPRRPEPLETGPRLPDPRLPEDRKSTRLNSSHVKISYAVFCLKKKKKNQKYLKKKKKKRTKQKK